MRPEPDGPPQPRQQASSQKRKLAAILHADVVAFSRLMGEDEAGTHQALGRLRQRCRPSDSCAKWPDRRHRRRQLAGGFFERGRRAELRRRDAAGSACHQRADPARTPSRAADRCQSWRRHRRWRQHLWRWHQHRRPAPGARQARYDLHLSDRLRAGQEQAGFPLPPARQPSRKEYRRAGSRLRGGGGGHSTSAKEKALAARCRSRGRCNGGGRFVRVGASRRCGPTPVRAWLRGQARRSGDPRLCGSARGASFGGGAAVQEPVRRCRP